MPTLTIRNISAETHRALRLRAVRNGRSTEAEVRSILSECASLEPQFGVGTLIANMVREAGIQAGDIDDLESVITAPDRHQHAKPVTFE